MKRNLDDEPEPFTMKELKEDRKVLFCAKTMHAKFFMVLNFSRSTCRFPNCLFQRYIRKKSASGTMTPILIVLNQMRTMKKMLKNSWNTSTLQGIKNMHRIPAALAMYYMIANRCILLSCVVISMQFLKVLAHSCLSFMFFSLRHILLWQLQYCAYTQCHHCYFKINFVLMHLYSYFIAFFMINRRYPLVMKCLPSWSYWLLSSVP